jgi:hypothetical protein
MQNFQKIDVVPYERDYARAWDVFVRGARNTHFFFQRGFLEYHGDRFKDASLLVKSRNEIITVLPANVDEEAIFSHQGLTYGGFLVDRRMTGCLMMSIFQTVLAYWQEHGIRKITYKVIPHIYHLNPSEEDLYALHLIGARVVRRDLSSVIALSEPIRFTKGKKANLAKAIKRSLTYSRSRNFGAFMALVEKVLDIRHGTRPTHSAMEIQILADRFPEHVRLYCTYERDNLLAGALLFINPTVVHTQYLASSDAGLEIGALDFLLDALITREFPTWRYMSFGISTENGGRILNQGLLHSKEAFGARGIVHDTYEISL